MIETVCLDAGDGVAAFSTLRGCTRADDPYDGLNCCHYTGDEPAHVAASREALAGHLGISPGRMIIPRQTHSVNVAVIADPDAMPSLEDVDALVTPLPGVALVIHTADCTPLLLNDPQAGVIAAIHAGWRGAVGGIALNALRAMAALGADPRRIIAAMGPAICPDCFETSPEIASRFPAQFVSHPAPGGRPHADIAALIRAQLIHAGVRAEAIAMPPQCTRCRHDRFFSARRLGVASGRMSSVIMRRG